MTPRAQFPDEQVQGEFRRQDDAFREWITADGANGRPAVPGRYHLYVSLACPWATRVAIVRAVLGLENVIGLSVVDPVRDERGWAFRDGPGFSRDPVNGFSFLAEAYAATAADYRGRVTVPVLWDTATRKILNNSEDDICRMLNDAFRAHVTTGVDLFPKDLREEQAQLSDFIYEHINNGVYRAGFATRQAVYERACRDVFAALDDMERRLAASRYLFGRRIVETDWRLFNTLVRFDPVYHGHFKCNLRRIVDYPNLQGYLQDLYQQPGIGALVNFDHIKRHYYVTHTDINPTRIVPLGPLMTLSAPHGRERL